MSDDWPQIKARLLTLAELAEHDGDSQSTADIRAALQRVEGLEFDLNHECAELLKQQCECAVLRQRVEELEEMYTSLGRNYDMLEKRAEAAEARVEEQDKLLDAHEKAFERQVERAEAAEAKLARVVEILETRVPYAQVVDAALTAAKGE